MVSDVVFNMNNILSVKTAQRIAGAVVILFVLQCIGVKDTHIFAQTAGDEPGMANAEPELISETVEPVAESWEGAEGFGEKIDWIHANLYKIAQEQVERFDYWFEPPQGEQRISVEPSRFRIGLFGEGKIQEYKDIEVKPVVDFDTEIDLPNLERRMKFIITTTDPATMPGRSFFEQMDKSLRTVLLRQWLPDLSTAVGVRLRWRPELFAYALWARDWEAGNWRLYPQQKIYWENEEGVGEISTLVLDHWIDRWNTRFSTSIKWSKQDRDNDKSAGREDNGFRWSEVFLLEYAKELLDESQLGRVISGDDIARGLGVRLSAFGGFHFADEYRAGVFYRWPMRKKWLYSFAGPEIRWRNEDNWNREWIIKCGIEMFFWGGNER